MRINNFAKEHLKRHLSFLYTNRDKYYRHARSARKIVEKSVRNHELRMAKIAKQHRTKEQINLITKEGFIEFNSEESKLNLIQ
jgi:hypothetical protein